MAPRRRFGPEVEIHVRDERRLWTCRRSGRLPLDELELPAEEGPDEEEGLAELPRIEPTVAAAEPTDEATVVARGAELLVPAVGAGTAGAGTFGLVGTAQYRHGDGPSRHRHLGHRNGDRGHGNGDRRNRDRNSVRQGVAGHEAGSQQDRRRCYGPHTWITLEGPNRLRRLRGKTQFSKDGRCR